MPQVRHRIANPKGGIQLLDPTGVIPGAVKDIAGKVASKLVKGDISDMLKISAPAIVHVERTYVEGAAADQIWSSRLLTKAAECQDPIERLKWVSAYYLAGNHISPSDCQCRAPLNPILGETV